MTLRGQVAILATVIGSVLALAKIEVDPLGGFTAVGLALVLMGHMQSEQDQAGPHSF